MLQHLLPQLKCFTDHILQFILLHTKMCIISTEKTKTNKTYNIIQIFNLLYNLLIKCIVLTIRRLHHFLSTKLKYVFISIHFIFSDHFFYSLMLYVRVQTLIAHLMSTFIFFYHVIIKPQITPHVLL